MGIQGLHEALRPYGKPVHVSELHGLTLAADGYSWLHKGVFSCALSLALGQAPWATRGRPTPYVEYCLHRARPRLPCRRGAVPARLAGDDGTQFPPRARRCPASHRFRRQMRLLRYHGVTPTLVFDGDRLPAKAREESARRERRAAKMAAGHAALQAGNRQAAETAFQAAVDVTPQMAREVMDGLSAEGFSYQVAPFEADSQCVPSALTGSCICV